MDGSAPISLEPLRLRSPGASSDDTLEFDGCDTLSQLFLARTRVLGDKTAHMEKHLGIWHRFSWNHYRETVATVAGGLAARGLGRPGAARDCWRSYRARAARRGAGRVG